MWPRSLENAKLCVPYWLKAAAESVVLKVSDKYGFLVALFSVSL